MCAAQPEGFLEGVGCLREQQVDLVGVVEVIAAKDPFALPALAASFDLRERARAAELWIVKEATKVLTKAAVKVGKFVVKEVKYAANQLMADVQSEAVQDAAACYQGAASMDEALSGSLESWPFVEAFSLTVGCLAETQDAEVDKDYVHDGG